MPFCGLPRAWAKICSLLVTHLLLPICLCAAVLVAGGFAQLWPSLQPALLEAGFFSDLCIGESAPCQLQRRLLLDLHSVSVGLTDVSVLLQGLLCDMVGPRRLGVAGASVAATGQLMLVVSLLAGGSLSWVLASLALVLADAGAAASAWSLLALGRCRWPAYPGASIGLVFFLHRASHWGAAGPLGKFVDSIAAIFFQVDSKDVLLPLWPTVLVCSSLPVLTAILILVLTPEAESPILEKVISTERQTMQMLLPSSSTSSIGHLTSEKLAPLKAPLLQGQAPASLTCSTSNLFMETSEEAPARHNIPWIYEKPQLTRESTECQVDATPYHSAEIHKTAMPPVWVLSEYAGIPMAQDVAGLATAPSPLPMLPFPTNPDLTTPGKLSPAAPPAPAQQVQMASEELESTLKQRGCGDLEQIGAIIDRREALKAVHIRSTSRSAGDIDEGAIPEDEPNYARPLAASEAKSSSMSLLNRRAADPLTI